MPRPIRIEYEYAFYHVMNRGRTRETVFHDERYFQAFLDTLVEAHKRFRCVIHVYCLMSNHVHLLVLVTPYFENSIGKMMQTLGRYYLQYFNHS